MEMAIKKFRMSEFIKDGYLAKALREELKDLSGTELETAQEAIVEVATSGIAGTFDELLAEYRRGIRRALHPERKTVKHAKIDRDIVKNAQLGAVLDRELADVTKEELARANAAVKRILDTARALETHNSKGEVAQRGEERLVNHGRLPLCAVEGEHSTLGGCGYFKEPAAWEDVFRTAVREAIAT